ncbi:MAG: xanthine phosphoribosyltransferase [Clostridia bacterium]|nr:xanthine phosphoribosyltransferase [Clostridia bacterium]
MQLLKERIKKDGRIIGDDILKVDSFLNHQIDPVLMDSIGAEFYRLFSDVKVDRVLTIEASGIAAAVMTAKYFGCPLVFAKKSRTVNQSASVYSSKAFSFTHKTENNVIVSREFIRPGENVLIIDDFLANGCALRALKDIVLQAGANPVGAGIIIEKAFQPGGDDLRAEGLRIESLARIKSMSEKEGIEFL